MCSAVNSEMRLLKLDAVMQVQEKNVEQLLSAASYLQIDSVMDACSEVILWKLSCA